ncbi:MAG: hypothetical protein QOC81_1810 [Thermoanaerobaculia bacterium]|jgi:hypothetical protein|nr:hypothetical protein [Thermoanaerobaculia bacterium]
MPRAGVHVDVEELPATRHWRVRYEFPAQVSEISFPNTRAPFRSKRWTIVEPVDATWNRLGDHDTIVFRSPTSHTTVEFADDFSEREKDYLLNVAFTDGSRLLYTGHLRVSDEPHAWRFHSAADRTIRTPDRSATGSLTWSSSEETYVYFGSIAPVSTPRMTLIVDPGLPSWIAKQLRERVPPMFDYYAAKMRTDLGFRPLVLLSYGGASTSGRSFKGGTVRRLVQLDVSGSGWTNESAEGAEDWYRHVAHEVFHLWESQRFVKDDSAEWLGESTAEYASLMAFHDLGGGDEKTIHRRVVEAASDCITTIGDTSLATAIDSGHFGNVYSCGLVTQWIAASRTGNAWQLFRKTFDRPAPYTTADYLSSLRTMTSSPEGVQQLVTGRTERGDWFLTRQLSASGIAVQLVPVDQATATQTVLRKALSAMVTRCACRIALEPLCSGNSRIETVDEINGRFKPGEALARVMRSSEQGDVLIVNAIPLQCSKGDLDGHFTQLLRIAP